MGHRGDGTLALICRHALECVGDSVAYAEIMGVSGTAWRLIWDEGMWSPDNLRMGWYGHLLAEGRIAAAFGYEYAYIDRDPETRRTAPKTSDAVPGRTRRRSSSRGDMGQSDARLGLRLLPSDVVLLLLSAEHGKVRAPTSHAHPQRPELIGPQLRLS